MWANCCRTSRSLESDFLVLEISWYGLSLATGVLHTTKCGECGESGAFLKGIGGENGPPATSVCRGQDGAALTQLRDDIASSGILLARDQPPFVILLHFSSFLILRQVMECVLLPR
jgi:hypothetical protein